MRNFNINIQQRRFYVLIAILLSCQVSTSTAAPTLGAEIGGWLNYVGTTSGNGNCYICVPVTGYSPSQWENRANNWVASNSAVRTELNELECGYTENVAPGVKATTRLPDSLYAICTTNGWATVQQNPSVHYDTCSDIDSTCSSYRDSNKNSYKMQQQIGYLAENYGWDMTSPKWQVCMYGPSNDFCYNDGGDESTCPAGQYYEAGDGVCNECPYADFYSTLDMGDGGYVADGDAQGTSIDNNPNDIYSCYIPEYVNYIDDTGVFNFINDCYYGS